MRAGLIAASELGRRVADGSSLVVIDMRQEPNDGRPMIPGSVWTTLHHGFAMVRQDRDLQYDVPTAEEFAAEMSRLGANPRSEIVVGDEMGNRWATRVFWLLRYFGHEGPVSVLDGGIGAYLAGGGPTAAEFATPAPGDYPVPTHRDESIRATADEVKSDMAAGTVVLCDVRTPQEYTGEVALSGRGGHLPGAVHVPWEAALAQDGTFLPNDSLQDVLAPYMLDGRAPVTYCQGGIRASLTWFALDVLLGHPARLYAGSWEDWAPRHELPVEAGL